ncbi:hypothetical protein AN286_00220 [Aliarcobacter cryaerophilus ATCC 43158]|uniref:Uncharacterized protein n=1 Tax=Aliarcobacter cryaerophilus ATCC 43158 TaxID=1032070 RepID=A0AAD0U091_9BACT|nr:hypothetical protein [Aliarcobacter cryaerophilus]AYJ80577.1 hypothetical protein ACRYA_1459 [Aliarcobacter cryaerophilus ATCC 43158]PRM96184.1 hypothetical protein CJ667_08235 [Aliarcobacter cryaerophilus]QCZ22911.1 hypothetical protein AN286_00220 [Aliarcobacter cryaerophilus ATCC 43158]
MRILLICDTAIIEHIFILVCKRIKVDLIVQKTASVDKKYDLIIVDQPFIDNKFNKIKTLTARLGAISSEELSFEKQRDFLIPRPFLPTKLEAILKEQIELLSSEKKDSKNLSKFISAEEEELVLPVVDFINDSLDDSEDFDNYDDLSFVDDLLDENENEDESIISLSALQKGGVLDNLELTKINTILKDDKKQIDTEADWKDISEIIDEALDEVKDYEFSLDNNKYHLVLNRFKIDELKPLLAKLDQNLINRLASGESVDISISIKE